jgi:hypothetical protein
MTELRRDNVFVVGCQRSGTSVVWAGLTAHPDLAPLRGYDAETGYDPKELHYFRNLFAGRREFASPMYGWDVDATYLRRVIDLTIEHCIEHHGSRTGRFVNAHPGDGLYLAEIRETMPEARIVYVLRHPEEVVWSAVHAPWADPGRTRHPETLRQAAFHWRNHAMVAKRVLDGEFGEAVLLVRHEELIDSPESVATRLADHVGIDAHPAMLAQLAGPTFNSSFKNAAPPRQLASETRRAISRASHFRRIVHRAIGREMEELGYTDLGNPPLVAGSGWRSLFVSGS